jgi:type IX secretion system PorP/SprF family membrane protein
MRQFFFLLILAIFAHTAKAQQTPFTLFYRNNWQFVNPAAIDRAHYLTSNTKPTVINVGSRAQWLGLDGAPLFYFASAEYCPERPQTLPHHKFGVTAFGDQTDALGTYGFYGNYSYYFPLGYSRGKVLHIGISPGFIWSNLNTDKLRGEPGTNPLNDPAVANNNQRGYFDFAFGALYRNSDRFYFGVSVPQTFSLNIYQSGNNNNKAPLFKTQRIQHFNVHCGWFIRRGAYDLSASGEETTWTLEPSVWVRITPGITYATLIPSNPFSIDANFRAHYRQKFWFGAGGGTNGIANLEAGFYANMNEAKMQVGIGYGVPVIKKIFLGHSVELTASLYLD